jgi:cytosine/adenosine deaminase-related metal-dependent hydrolase
VWCPSSNLYLLGRTAPIDRFLDSDPSSCDSIALGTDSRLSGSRDLLEELRVAQRAATVAPLDLARMVTANAACLLRVPEAGRIAPGLPADLVVIPPLAEDPAHALLALDRSRIRLVTVGGRPLVGAPELSSVFAARRVATSRAKLDGQARILDGTLVRRIRASSLAEPGLEL